MLKRIDENSSIDMDYLLCCEYQLFIDEKREVGESCQPTHWQSDRYLRKDANEPVTGILLSDAEEFCKWLTLNQQQNLPGFRYRLPTLTEAEKYPAIEKHIGCWCQDGNQTTIVGIESDQWNVWRDHLVRVFEQDYDCANDLGFYNALELLHVLNRLCHFNLGGLLDKKRIPELDGDSAMKRIDNRIRNLNLKNILACDGVRDLENNLNQSIDEIVPDLPRKVVLIDHDIAEAYRPLWNVVNERDKARSDEQAIKKDIEQADAEVSRLKHLHNPVFERKYQLERELYRPARIMRIPPEISTPRLEVGNPGNLLGQEYKQDKKSPPELPESNIPRFKADRLSNLLGQEYKQDKKLPPELPESNIPRFKADRLGKLLGQEYKQDKKLPPELPESNISRFKADRLGKLLGQEYKQDKKSPAELPESNIPRFKADKPDNVFGNERKQAKILNPEILEVNAPEELRYIPHSYLGIANDLEQDALEKEYAEVCNQAERASNELNKARSLKKARQDQLTHYQNQADIRDRELTEAWRQSEYKIEQLSEERTQAENFACQLSGNDKLEYRRSYLLVISALLDSFSNYYQQISRDRKLLRSSGFTYAKCRNLMDKYADKSKEIINFYTYLLLIDERRAGRIPAWEGIRIVREREQ